MEQEIEKRFCQSCGMPLDLSKVQYLGTRPDKTFSDEYCYYCLKDGEYTVDYSMLQMVDVWVKYTDKYNEYAGTDYKPEEIRSILNERMPKLKRWRQRKETENIHFEIINRIQVYINQHLFEPLDAGLLSQIAELSLFHFRRVFKMVTGENISSYIQRLRLEYIAYKITSTDIRLTEIISRSQVYTKYSLSKAFSKHFGVSPSVYRERFKAQTIATAQSGIQPEIKRIPVINVLYLQVGKAYADSKAYHSIWSRLMTFSHDHNLTGETNKFVSISQDEPAITKSVNCRFYIGIIVDELVKPTGPFGIMQIPGGLYAVFRFKGNYSLLPEAYRDIYLHRLPVSGYRQSEPLTFEVYINTPRQVPASDLLTDIYVPIDKIKT